MKLKKRESIENYSRIQKKDEANTTNMKSRSRRIKKEEMTQQIGEATNKIETWWEC